MLAIYREFSEDRIPTVAGGITFFALLALFPAIGSVVSLYGIFADRGTISHDIDMMSGFLPGGAVTVLRGEVQRLVTQKPETLSMAFLGSTLVALWSASGGFKALVDGLNIAYEVPERRSFFRLALHALIFTLAAVLFATIAIALSVGLPAFSASRPVLTATSRMLVWPFAFAACTLVMAVIYRFGPDREHPKWRGITWGSAVAALLWLIGTRIFAWYVENYGSYNRIYGDLGAAIGFLTWIWLSLVIVLLGAEINCELERRAEGNKHRSSHH